MRPVEGHSGDELLRQEIDLSEVEYQDDVWESSIRLNLVIVGAKILAAAMTSPTEIDAAIAAYVLEIGEDPVEVAKAAAGHIIDEKAERIKFMLWGMFDTDLPKGVG